MLVETYTKSNNGHAGEKIYTKSKNSNAGGNIH